MSGLTAPQPSPQERPSSSPSTSFPLHAYSSKGRTQRPARAVDEMSEFYDPFSDLNLFLSQKIKRELIHKKSPKKWSSAIEANLLSAILPEFKKKFPTYRLGKNALKKIWEKVAYYCEKIYSQAEATSSSGQLNLPFMIRENLKSTTTLPSDLPPHAQAHQIAAKIGECIATLDGNKISINHLTKLIWAIQKHLLPDEPSTYAHMPREDYDAVDKLVLKTMLDTLAHAPLAPLSAVQKKLKETRDSLDEVFALAKKEQLISTLSKILAAKLEPHLTASLSREKKEALQQFIDYHFFLSRHNPKLSIETQPTEIVQRILSIAALAPYLPSTIDDRALRASISHVLSLVKNRSFSASSGIESALFVFIHAEMHLISNQKHFGSLQATEERIALAYAKTRALLPLAPADHELVEPLMWTTLAREKSSSSSMSPHLSTFLTQELGHALIDSPNQTFRQTVSHLIHQLTSIRKVLGALKDATSLQQLWDEKVALWSAQNSMACRFLHVDKESPLLHHLLETWSAHSHGKFSLQTLPLDKVQDTLQQKFPLLSLFSPQLKTRLWVLAHYLWHTELASPGSTGFERFIRWHATLHPEKSKEDLMDCLRKVVPFMPIAS